MISEPIRLDNRARPLRSRLGALLVVSAVVGLNVASAVLLKTIADRREAGWLVVSLVVAAVVAINVAKFVVWGFAHGRYALSQTYPLTSLFFPAMVLISVHYGEQVALAQILGAVLITLGVVWLTLHSGKAGPGQVGRG